jgi:hypothetical protein
MPDNEEALLIQHIKEKVAGLERFKDDLVLDKYLGELDMLVYQLRTLCFPRIVKRVFDDKWLEELEKEIGNDLDPKESGTNTGDLHG